MTNENIKNCMVDWLEFSVYYLSEGKLLQIDEIIKILDLNDFHFETRTSRNYRMIMSHENCINIMSGIRLTGKIRDHIHIQITGAGCRLLEQKYNVKSIRDEIRTRFIFHDIKINRMDICIDTSDKFVELYKDEVINRNYDGLKANKAIVSDSITLYLGSRSSKYFFRLYEKDKESGDNRYMDRVEVVLKDVYADNEFHNQASEYSVMSQYMKTIEWYKPELQKKWLSYMGDECRISEKIKHKKTTLQEKMVYILGTYAKTMKAYIKVYGTKEITRGIHESIMSDKELNQIRTAEALKLIKLRNKRMKRLEVIT